MTSPLPFYKAKYNISLLMIEQERLSYDASVPKLFGLTHNASDIELS